ncbi:SGNH/GDSL hydrolase family protein [bacterium]|nr:SGNH/GDSL hydrolase family protein [bacterium]
MKKLLFTILILITFISSQNIDCVGSSITRNGYPGYTDNLMVANGYVWRVHNYEVPGAGVVQSAYKDTSVFEEVLSRKSERVVLLLGANDWVWYSVADQNGKDRWRSEYEYLVEEFSDACGTVVLGYLIHRVDVGDDVTLANATMDTLNVVIDAIANKYSLTIIDFKTAIGMDPTHFWSSDGLHPNSLGSQLMGIAAYEHFKEYYHLSIDDEYWEATEDYDNQKPSLFNGCSMKRVK